MYDIGYEINKILRYRLQFGPRTIIGAFNVMFAKRFNFQFKARTHMSCLAMRKKNWDGLFKQFKYFSECMKILVMYNYTQHVRRPMLNKKVKDIKKYMKRNDYDQLLTLKDYEENEMNQMKIEAFRRIEARKQGQAEESIILRTLQDKVNDTSD